MKRLTRCAVPVVLSFCCASASRSAISQQITPFELGIGYYGQTNTNFAGTDFAYRRGYSGPLARLTFNVNRSIALEASGFDSTNIVPSGNKVGGHQALALAGIKVGIRRRHVAVFGRFDAGVASYSRGLEFVEVERGRVIAGPFYYRETHFALETGGTVELPLTRRTIVRADFDENLNAIFRNVNSLGGASYQAFGGYVPHHFAVGLSLERRFGTFKDEPALSPQREHISIGGYFPLQIRGQTLPSNAPALGGGGAWIELPTFRFVSTDLVAFDIPHDDFSAGPQDGGTPLAAFAGPKAGFHMGNFGIFAKARPGVTRFSRTVSNLTIPKGFNGMVTTHPQYQFSLDMGAVVEYTPARHLLLRLEAGDDLICYHSHDETYHYTYQDPAQSGVMHSPAKQSSTMLFLAGAGWRF